MCSPSPKAAREQQSGANAPAGFLANMMLT
jgi:hypothetical protein